MGPGVIILFLLFPAFLCGSAFFSGSETAFFSLSRFQINRLTSEGGRAGELVGRLMAHPDFLLNGILLGNLTVNVAATACAAIITHHLGQAAGLAPNIVYLGNIVVMTFLILVLGEISPKVYSVTHAERLAPRLARPLAVWLGLCRPFVRAVTVLSTFVTDRVGAAPGPSLTEEELETLVKVTAEEGDLEAEEREMIRSIFGFGETRVKEIVVPRIDMVCVEETAPIEEILRVAQQSERARIPVYRQSVDQIVGILYTKDLLRYKYDLGPPPKLTELIREAYFVPDSKEIDDLLREFQARRTHMAIVVDEYGGTAGLVTIEDVVEEIVGEIRDEYDVEEPLYQAVDEGAYVVDGRLDLDDLSRLVGVELDEEVETLGGLVYKVFGRIPRPLEEAEYNGLRFRVLKVKGKRIMKVMVRRVGPVEEEAEEG